MRAIVKHNLSIVFFAILLMLTATVIFGTTEDKTSSTGPSIELDETAFSSNTELDDQIDHALVDYFQENLEDEALEELNQSTVRIHKRQVYRGQNLKWISSAEKRNLSTVMSANNLYKEIQSLSTSKLISIPNQDGVFHKVTSSKTLEGLLSELKKSTGKYDSKTLGNISADDILLANDITEEEIRPGDLLFIPNVTLAGYIVKNALGFEWIAPVSGRISSVVGYRGHPVYGTRRYHAGLDIAQKCGVQIKAVKAGTIIFKGWKGGYGNAVMIKHSRGVETLYGHMKSFGNIYVGQWVNQGTIIGRVGTTGVSTGCHLHYEMRENGKIVNPTSKYRGRIRNAKGSYVK